MKHLKDSLNLILEDVYVGSSDKSVYKRLAQHKWNHMETASKKSIERAKKIILVFQMMIIS